LLEVQVDFFYLPHQRVFLLNLRLFGRVKDLTEVGVAGGKSKVRSSQFFQVGITLLIHPRCVDIVKSVEHLPLLFLTELSLEVVEKGILVDTLLLGHSAPRC
jgi:hypothetical protein